MAAKKRGIKVLKFGGTSMGSADAMQKVIAAICAKHEDARVAAVVVSAMGGVTDQLIAIANMAAAHDPRYKKTLRELGKRHERTVRSLISRRRRSQTLKEVRALLAYMERVVQGISLVRELSPATLDYVMSYGERLSAHILSEALQDRGVACEYLNARNIITTDGIFGEATVDFPITNKRVRAHFKKHPKLQMVTGFIASSHSGKTTTIGRGGSDYSTSIIAAALGARTIEIWTDVSGVYTADPRKVPEAYPLHSMTYLEAIELSYFGAKVIHPPTMRPAMEKNIPIIIKNTFKPEASGTHISRSAPEDAALAKGISSVGDMAVLRIEGSGMARSRGMTGRLFNALSESGINVTLITQGSSQNSISIAVAFSSAEKARKVVEEEFALERARKLINPVIVESKLAVLAIVGEGMRHKRGTAGKLFSTLGEQGINIIAISQGSSELNISVVIREKDVTRALCAIHDSFFFPSRRVVNVFLVGTGLIGSTLLGQIAKQRKYLQQEREYIVRVLGVANAKHMIFSESGIPLIRWKRKLSASRKRAELNGFIERIKLSDVPNKVFVDCTASNEVASRYADILEAGISVVTPNKKAASGPYSYYARLKKLASKPGVKFLYETNAGAALPVLSTLYDLLLNGDRVIKIEAILSGTLSYIFNTFVGSKPFSDIVREAKEKGYTEPDPRADLSGEDVARKITILAREIGVPLELKDVRLEGLVSAKAKKAPSADASLVQLKKEDSVLEKRRAAAQRAGKRLRYIAKFEKGKASVSLQALGPEHPFYEMRGSDNVVAFTTTRYRETPLVVRGPGAGAAVTAGGVFADILRAGMK
ncbi:MAG: bifunctional aspartate kinase/homoserine dehydrogenase I [Patescibacteria group bacterium]|nr:bifunctional aspartate kinase/homoserine dehydrogenase I [Patescibacteria group bacterium]